MRFYRLFLLFSVLCFIPWPSLCAQEPEEIIESLRATISALQDQITNLNVEIETVRAEVAAKQAELDTAMAAISTARTQGRADVTGDPASYNLYTAAGLRALHVGKPLLLRDATNGKFRLTLALQSSTNLIDFAPKRFVPAAIAINSAGELEFEFDVPESAAFFRISAD